MLIAANTTTNSTINIIAPPGSIKSLTQVGP